jgi:hypothetical protein
MSERPADARHDHDVLRLHLMPLHEKLSLIILCVVFGLPLFLVATLIADRYLRLSA